MTYEELASALLPEVLLTPEMLGQLRKYAALLQEWGSRMNLTAITEEGEVVAKHFYDCLLPSQAVPLAGRRAADLGSGAGFPGLVWAIAFPAGSFVLIEATAKKGLFLKAAIRELGLRNAAVAVARAESYGHRESFDLVASRAFGPLSPYLEVAAPLAKVGGLVLAMKGPKGKEELAQSGAALHELSLRAAIIQEKELPGGEGSRVNIFFRKEAPTPKAYPRPWGVIAKKPL